MSTSAGTVTVDFAVEMAKFRADLTKIQKQLDGMGGSFKTLETVAKGALAFLSVSAITSFATGVAKAALEIDRLSQKTGIAVDSLSRLQYATQQSNTDFAALTQGITQFQNRLAKGEATDAIHSLGLELTKIRSLDVEGQLLAFSAGFQALSDPAERVRVSMELFGKAGADLLPFLIQGPEAIAKLTAESDKLGNTLSSKTVAELDRAEKAANRLKAAIAGVATEVLAGTAALLLPSEISDQQKFNNIFERRLEIQAQLSRYAALPDPLGLNKISVKILNAELDQNTIKLAEFQQRQKQVIIEAGRSADALRAAAAQKEAEANTVVDLGTEVVNPKFDQLEFEIQLDDALIAQQLKTSEELTRIVADQVNESGRWLIEGEEAQLAAAERANNREIEDGAKREEALLRIKQDGLNAAQTLLTAYGGKYKKFAQALLLWEKAKAVANIAIETQASASKAYSAYAYAPPLAIAAAGAAYAFGAARIAAVAAAFIGGSSAPQLGGSTASPVITNNTDTSLSNDQRPTAQAQKTTQVIFNGPVYNTDDFQRSIVDALKDVSDRDVIIFAGNSAQAQAIRAA